MNPAQTWEKRLCTKLHWSVQLDPMWRVHGSATTKRIRARLLAFRKLHAKSLGLS